MRENIINAPFVISDFPKIRYSTLDLLLEFIMIEHKCHFCDKCYGENISSKHLSQRLHLENLLKIISVPFVAIVLPNMMT